MPDAALVYVLSSEVGEVGGAAKATRLLCDALAASGAQVRLFVTLPPKANTRARLVGQGIEIVTPPFNRGWALGWPQRQIAVQLWLSARRRRPAAILSVSLSREARYLLQLGSRLPVYLWETTEALPHVKFRDPRIHTLLNRAGGVLVPSETVARNVRQTYGYEGPILTLPFWVDPPPGSGGATAEETLPSLLYVGRLDPDKGFAYLFEAMNQVRAQVPDAQLTVCGAGDPEPIRKLAAGRPGISVAGYIDDAAYEAAIAASTAMVLASLHEGYPLSLLEACARGRPVIATQVGSIPEIFAGRLCAILAAPRDAAGLAEAMIGMLTEDADRRLERRRDARLRFDELCAPDAISKRLDAILDHAASLS